MIVEGYTDALMAHQVGFENVVASLGTALTPQQVALVTRYAKRIALAYDVDAAGEKAGTFGATALEEVMRQLAPDDSGVELDDVRVVQLPVGKDPDEVVRDKPDEWREVVRTARPIVDHLIDVHARAHDLRTPGGQARFVDAVLPIIRNLPNPVLRDAYLQRVQQVAASSSGRCWSRCTAARCATPTRATGGSGSAPPRSSGPPTPCRSTTSCAASRARSRSCSGSCSSSRRRTTPSSTGSGRIACRARSHASCTARSCSPVPATTTASVRRTSLTAILDGLDEESRALGQALVSRPGPNPRELTDHSLSYEIERLILELDDAEWQDRAAWNRDAMGEAERDDDRELIDRLSNERRLLNEQRRSLDRRRDQTRLLARQAVPAG